mgnify:CR=1 FL=1
MSILNRYYFIDEGWIHIELSPEYMEHLLELVQTLDYLLDKYSEATVIFATSDVYLDDTREEEVLAWYNTSLLVVPRMYDFVKSHWGREVEIESFFNNTLLSGIRLTYIVFGVPSLIKRDEIEKFLEAEGIKVTRQMRKREDVLQELAVKSLLTRWLEEGVKRSGTKDMLENFRKNGITKIEVYSIKDKKWAGKKPPDFDCNKDDITSYLVVSVMNVFQ